MHSVYIIKSPEAEKRVVPDSCCKTITPQCGKRDHPSNIYKVEVGLTLLTSNHPPYNIYSALSYLCIRLYLISFTKHITLLMFCCGIEVWGKATTCLDAFSLSVGTTMRLWTISSWSVWYTPWESFRLWKHSCERLVTYMSLWSVR